MSEERPTDAAAARSSSNRQRSRRGRQRSRKSGGGSRRNPPQVDRKLYQQVPGPSSPVPPGVIRISNLGKMNRYVHRILGHLQGKVDDPLEVIQIVGLGRAMQKTVSIVEIVKRNLAVHQLNKIETVQFRDRWVPRDADSDLEPIIVERSLPALRVTLTLNANLIDTSSGGYQPPVEPRPRKKGLRQKRRSRRRERGSTSSSSSDPSAATADKSNDDDDVVVEVDGEGAPSRRGGRNRRRGGRWRNRNRRRNRNSQKKKSAKTDEDGDQEMADADVDVADVSDVADVAADGGENSPVVKENSSEAAVAAAAPVVAESGDAQDGGD